MAFARDLSAAVRSLRKSPGFTCAVVGMLAVGIGATTAMFSVANGVLFAPLPYTNEKRLVAFVNHGTRGGGRTPATGHRTRDRELVLDARHSRRARPSVRAGRGRP